VVKAAIPQCTWEVWWGPEGLLSFHRALFLLRGLKVLRCASLLHCPLSLPLFLSLSGDSTLGITSVNGCMITPMKSTLFSEQTFESIPPGGNRYEIGFYRFDKLLLYTSQFYMVRINYMFIFNNALHLCIYSYFLVVLKDESRASPMLGKRSTTKPTSQPQDALCELWHG
jgi:hypothetical protein